MHSDIKNSALYFLQGPRVGSQTRQANLHHSACSLGEPLATFPTREKNKYFNNPTGVVRLIASSLDTDSLLNLSRVNKKCSLIFSNEYFKDHFLNKICQRFPGLEKTFNDILDLKNVNYLVHSYPSNCWKVFCWVFSKPDCRNFPLPKSNIEYKKVLLSLQANWKMLIEKTLPEEIKKICGTGYADPNSKIHKAWILSEYFKIKQNALEEEVKLFHQEYDNLIDEDENILISDNSGSLGRDVTDKIISEIFYKLELEFSNKKFDFDLFLDGYKSNINKNFIESVKSVKGFVELAEYKKEFAKKSRYLRVKSMLLDKCTSLYKNLELEKARLDKEIKCISNIYQSSKNIGVEVFKEIHILKLIALKNFFVFNVINCLKEDNYKNKEVICMLINSTSMRNRIWNEFYNNYANENIEENWYKNNFHEPNITDCYILERYEYLTKKQLEVLDFNENFKLKWLEEKEKILHLMKSAGLKELNILGKLYDECANGKIEENWSENHFHEHLEKLKALITVEYNNSSNDDNKELLKKLDDLFYKIQMLNRNLRYLLPN